MKYILAMNIAICLTFQISGMEYYDMERREGNGRILYVLTNKTLPTITIDQCTCGKAASKRCSKCQFVFYCNNQCQSTDWENHKNACKGIQKIHCGEISHMRNLFSAYVNKAAATDPICRWKYLKNAMLWHLKTIIRLQQDLACAKDNPRITTGGAVLTAAQVRRMAGIEEPLEKVTKEHIQQFESLELTAEQLQLLEQETKPQALEWVQHLTDEDKLVLPYNFRQYGIERILLILEEEREFHPRSEWKQRRKKVLQILRHVKSAKSAAKR